MKFTILDGPKAGDTFKLGNAPLYIGRQKGVTVLLKDDRASRKHARLERRGDAVFVCDMESSNGTLVNGRMVEEAQLREGDVVTVGKTRICYGQAKGVLPRGTGLPSEAEAALGRSGTVMMSVREAEQTADAGSPSFMAAEVVEAALESLQPVTDEKHIKIAFDRPEHDTSPPVDANMLYAAVVSLLAAAVDAISGREPALRVNLQTGPPPEGFALTAFLEQGAADLTHVEAASQNLELAEALKPLQELGAIIEMPGTSTGQIFLFRLPPQSQVVTQVI